MPNKTTARRAVKATGPDRSKLDFGGQKLGKGRTVLAVVKAYVEKHPNITYAQLRDQFPDNLHSLGVVKPLPAARKASVKHRRFFLKEAIKLSDRTVAVCSDFGKNNIGKFLARAKELGLPVRTHFRAA